jgi:hypothetical protein
MFIAEWEWTDETVEHIGRHGARPGDVLDVWEGRPKFRQNRRGRAATHQMIGPGRGGAFFAVFIRQSELYEGVWTSDHSSPGD